MTQEELYVRLLNRDDRINPSEVNPEFLKNYEIAKLVLEKFGIHNLIEIQQRNLNLEAVSAWFRISESIELMYDIPEISELLPEKIINYLFLQNSQVQFLPQLESVGKGLFLSNSKIESLPELNSVGWSLDLKNSQIRSLPKLESVGGYLDLENSQIQSLPKLESVGGYLNLENSKIQSLPELEFVKSKIYTSSNKEAYWKRYFKETGRSDLAKKVGR